MSSLKLRPLGSVPTYLCTTSGPKVSSAIAYVSGLLHDCRVNGTATSPTRTKII